MSATLSTDFTTPRARKQLTLYLAGTTFFTLSTLLTRRAIHRKHFWPVPKFYTPSNQPPPPIELNTGVMAVEALQLATVNVMAFMIMVGGGVGWAWDVSGWEEVRGVVRKRRKGMEGRDGKGEEELEGLGLGELVRGMVGGEDRVVERAREKRRREEREAKVRGQAAEDEVKRMKAEEDFRVERLAAMENRTNSNQGSKPWWRPL